MPEIDCVAALCCVTLSLMPFRPEGRKKTVPISTQYATLSENGKALMLPEDVHTWFRGAKAQDKAVNPIWERHHFRKSLLSETHR